MSDPAEPTGPVDHRWPWVIAAWGVVTLPLAWGIMQTVNRAAQLFR